MLKNYLLVAFRILRKQKIYAAINIAGLAAGMACCCVIVLYVWDELSYDRFHEHAERIYRLTMTSRLSGGDRHFSRTPLAVAPVLDDALPEAEALVRLYGRSAGLQAIGTDGSPVPDKRFQEERFFFADSTVFRVFTFPLLRGNPATALARPHSIVLTEETARKYFGDSDPMGRTLLFEGQLPFRVTGVVRNVPRASSIQFDVLASFGDLLALEIPSTAEFVSRDWLFGSLSTYLLLREGASPRRVEQRLPALVNTHAEPQYAPHIRLALQPLSQMHLFSDFIDEDRPNAIVYVYIFSTVALLILLVACINFVNLATARSFARAREVGIRRALGAQRGQVIRQFLGESLLITFVAFAISPALIELLLPGVNALTDKHLSLIDNLHPGTAAACIGIFLCTALPAGVYPALLMARYRPSVTLRGAVSERASSGGRLRKTLVVAQFTISILLIVGAVVVSEQMEFMRGRPTGFHRDHVLTVPLFSENLMTILGTPIDAELRGTMNAFEDALLADPRISAVTLSSNLPGNVSVLSLVIPEGTPPDANIFFPWLAVDYDFVRSYGLEIVAGRDFSRSMGTDHLSAFLINEAAAYELGWAVADAPGRRLIRGDATGGKEGTVIGVVRNFHAASLHEPIKPLVIDVTPTTFAWFSIRIRNTDMPSTIAFVERTWKQFFPNRMFEYHFLDRQLDDMYRSEERLGRIIRSFAVLAVCISCLGLFGLASFTTTRRTREIGIRKVLGATVWNIVVLLVAEYSMLVLIAMLVALPPAWWGAHRWLEEFAYRIEPGPGLFLFAGAVTLLLALLTVGWLSVRAALRDPAPSLRYE